MYDEGTKRSKYPGFGVRVSHVGRKTFVMVYRRDGKQKRLTIGTFPATTLRKARDRRVSPTLAELAGQFRVRYVETDAIRPATAEDYARRLRVLVSYFGEMKVSDITLDDVEDYRDAGASTPVGTNRTIEVLSRVYSWARDNRDLRTYVKLNPCAGLKALPEHPATTSPSMRPSWMLHSSHVGHHLAALSRSLIVALGLMLSMSDRTDSSKSHVFMCANACCVSGDSIVSVLVQAGAMPSKDHCTRHAGQPFCGAS